LQKGEKKKKGHRGKINNRYVGGGTIRSRYRMVTGGSNSRVTKKNTRVSNSSGGHVRSKYTIGGGSAKTEGGNTE